MLGQRVYLVGLGAGLIGLDLEKTLGVFFTGHCALFLMFRVSAQSGIGVLTFAVQYSMTHGPIDRFIENYIGMNIIILLSTSCLQYVYTRQLMTDSLPYCMDRFRGG